MYNVLNMANNDNIVMFDDIMTHNDKTFSLLICFTADKVDMVNLNRKYTSSNVYGLIVTKGSVKYAFYMTTVSLQAKLQSLFDILNNFG